MAGIPTRIALACTLATGPLLGGIGTAGAQERPSTVHFVSPGKGTPIQDAVNRARPGDTILVRPGNYRENVVVSKSLTVLGSGMNRGGSVLTPPKKPGKDACQGTAGFCIAREGAPYARNMAAPKPIKDVTVKGFEVRGFSGSGVLGVGTENLVVEWMHAVNNHKYGVASFAGKKTVLANNTAMGSEEAGVYLGDSPDASAWVGDNQAYGNANGIMLRDSTGVTAAKNLAIGNCVGILALNTGAGATPGGRMTIRNNSVQHNTRACPAHEEVPALAGIGIALAGVHDVHAHHNTVRDNRATGPSIATGGIALFTTRPLGGADPRANRIVRNVVLDNRPVDLFRDRTADKTGRGNVFRGNQHGTSNPPGLG
jgi:parallel beta-helix repeat protein